MALFNWRGSKAPQPTTQRRTTVRRAQTIDTWERSIIGRLSGAIEVRGNLDLYDLMREVSPILDVAIIKLVQLIGDFELDAFGNTRAQEVLEATKRNIRVGWFGSGFSTFMTQLADSALAKGFAVGELVPDALLKGVDRLKVARANDFRFMLHKERLSLGQMDKNGFIPVDLEDQSLIYYLAFDLRDGHPQGVSMLSSLPAVVKTVMRIQQAIDSTAWRVGDPTFVVMEQAGKGMSPDELRESIGLKIDNLQEAMITRKAGGLMDIAMGYAPEGKLEVKVLGGDARMPDLTAPTKITMEQIVARTGLPPFMFGLSWATTERMAQEQSDMLTSEVWARRSHLDPIIDRIFTTALILNGLSGVKWKHEWEDVNLQDEEKTATSEKLEAEAEKIELEARLQLLDAGLVTVDSFISWLVHEGYETEEGIKSAGGMEVVSQKYQDNRTTKVALALTRVG